MDLSDICKQLIFSDLLNYQQSYLEAMIKITALILLIGVTCALYTPSYWKQMGKDVTDGKLEEKSQVSITLNTTCNDVNLGGAPYNYNGTVMSGYLKVGKGNSALGFIFYGREHTSKADLSKYPILIWLNGGPGSSSQLGNFMELGPFWIKPANMAPYEIVRNNYTWVKNYNVLFVDQPVGTGLSYADPAVTNAYCKSMSDVANDFYYALKELYQNTNGCFKKLSFSPNQDLVIFGESYAGKYAPAIALKIKQEQQNNKGFLTGLRGIAIGDGFTHPFDILSEMGEYAYNLGLLDFQERSKVEQMALNASLQYRLRDNKGLHNSFGTILDYIVERSGGVNVYDITKYERYPTILINEYFSQPSTISLFSLNRQIQFGAQGSNVYEALFEDFMKTQVSLVEELLRRKVHVLIYNGQNDLIVETPGTFKWTERLHHNDAEKFRETYFKVWKTGGKVSGYTKQAGYLELKTVNNAGHLVPMDQGEAALNLATTFVKKCTAKTL